MYNYIYIFKTPNFKNDDYEVKYESCVFTLLDESLLLSTGNMTIPEKAPLIEPQ